METERRDDRKAGEGRDSTADGPWIGVGVSAVLAVVGAFVWPGPPADEPGSAGAVEEADRGRISLGGDVMFGRWIAGERQSYEAPESFEDVRSHIRASDLAMTNLETGLCDRETAEEGRRSVYAQRHRFTAPPERLEWFVETGIDVAVVANNHAMDCGPEGLDHTLEALEERDVAAAGHRHREADDWAPTVVSFEGGDLSVVAATAHVPPLDPQGAYEPRVVDPREADKLVERVARTREQRPEDVVVASLHWGREHSSEPTRRQRQLAQRLAEAGADIVYGHGPHVLQPTEMIDGTAVVYSTGNLHFDMNRPDTRQVGLFDVILEFDERWRVVDVEQPFEGRIVEQPDDQGLASPFGGTDESAERPESTDPAEIEEAGADKILEPAWGGDERLHVFFDDERRRGFFAVPDEHRPWTSRIFRMWDVQLADLNANGEDEVVVGIWSYRVRHDESLPRKTIWVLGWDGRRLYPKWRGSAMPRPLRDFSIAEVADGPDELVTEESTGERCVEAVYRWNGFGFGEQRVEEVECSG